MLHKDTSGREIRSFYSFSAFSTDDCKSRLSRSRGHFMLQLSMSNDFEALIGRIDPYVGRWVKNEMFKTDIFCEENLRPRYGA